MEMELDATVSPNVAAESGTRSGTDLRSDETDDDEVVLEIPVSLEQPFAPAEVLLLQFPLRSPDEAHCIESAVVGARLKPRQRRVELDLGLFPPRASPQSSARDQSLSRHTNPSDHFDLDRLREFGSDHITLQSAEATMPRANFTLLRVHEQRAQLIPVHAVCALKPSMHRVDELERAAHGASSDALAPHDAPSLSDTDNDDTGEQSAGGGAAGSGAVGVGITFRKRETKRAQERRKSSFAYHLKLLEEEPWLPSAFHSSGSANSTATLLQLGNLRNVADEAQS